MAKMLAAADELSSDESIQPPPLVHQILRWSTVDHQNIPASNTIVMTDKGIVQTSNICSTKIEEMNEKNHFINRIVEEDHQGFLQKIRSRIDRVGVEIPTIEIRYEHLNVEGEVRSGRRALPTLINATMQWIEGVLRIIRLTPSKKRKLHILKDLNGIVKPSRMTLLLGPPGAGKTTFLHSLAGRLDKDLIKSGKITYCGHEFGEFVPQRTCAYVSEHDLHHGEMTARETLDFSARCLGVGGKFELLAELLKRENESEIKPDPEIDAFMKATAVSGQKTSLVTDYVLKILGLDTCSETTVGDDMRRGISGGEKKRLTTGELLVGPAKALLMDEISTGLDNSTTHQIIKYISQMVGILGFTMIISLLQPAPETFNIFDDIILLAEGEIVYQGPRENILEFFQYMGFKCPDRKGVADFLQEVTSKKDQEQYWFKENQQYRYISVPEFADAFKSFYIGRNLAKELSTPYDKTKAHQYALVTEKYGISNWELFKACFSREWLLMKRNYIVYICKIVQITVMSVIAFSVFLKTEMPYGRLTDGGKFYGALFFSLVNMMFNGLGEIAMTVFRLPVFYKQRDLLFYPAWAFGLPIYILGIPVSFLDSAIWTSLTYYTIGFAPSAHRFFRQFLAFFSMHQMSLGLFRFIAAIGRNVVVATTFSTFILLIVFVLGGFIIAKDDLEPWLRWAYYIFPMSYGQNAIVMNEFLDKRWSGPNTDPRFKQPTVGKVLLHARSFFTQDYWFWICIFALLGFSIIFNTLFIAMLALLNPFHTPNSIVFDDKKSAGKITSRTSKGVGINMQHAPSRQGLKKSIDLPFHPFSIVFGHLNYYVDMPAEMKTYGAKGDCLQLLQDVSGALRPGILTAIVGVSGAGKTTLMDVLAGRKTGGYIDGSISISGYQKNQETFARISGYCEQNDIHSPNVTVYESVLYSAWLRLPKESKEETRKMFVEEVMELVELNPIRGSLVGLPGIDGLSTEQRKRLTIAVELVANPSIIFMDEPTSGLDARAAAIVMRTVRNTVDTGRTVVCTIHQPSIDIFEAFDELLLMKRGGRIIYAGPLGHHSHKLIEYFEAVTGIPKIKDGYNPAAWILEISHPMIEDKLGCDFADIYKKSSLYQRNEQLIKELSTPAPDSEDLHFPTKYSQPFLTQCKACFWKQYWSYWRNPQYNAIRLFTTAAVGFLFGLIFWKKGQKTETQQDIQNLFGAIYSVVLLLGATNANSVQGLVAVERTVFYRERAAGLYSALPYAFTQVAIETIYVSVQTIVYTLLIYSMMGFEWTISKFLWFYYFIFTCFVYFTLYGMMLIALTPGLQFGAILAAFFLSFWNLFSGFLIPRPEIPIWWRWCYWGSPVAWTIYGIFTSQLGSMTSEVQVAGVGVMTVKNYLKENLGYDHNFLPIVGFMHLVFVVLFAMVFALGIKYLNFQKR